MQNRPPMIRTDLSNAFANNTMKVRVPKIIQDILDANPDYSTPIKRALESLRDEVARGEPMKMLELPAPDYELWVEQYAQHKDETWHSTPWFFAETFVYRRIVEAVRWWETGRDPFTPKKEEEYGGDSLWSLLDMALARDGSPEEKLSSLLLHALWGNRIDLSYMVAAEYGRENVGEEDLLSDDRKPAIETLLNGSGDVHIVADNAGTELAMDCALIDFLLNTIDERVILHVKMHPTFVSDTITADVLYFIKDKLSEGRSDSAQGLGQRLWDALEAGQLRIAPDFYWNSSLVMWQMPSRIVQSFQNARLVILKGDANYRRALDDAIWPADTPFPDAVSYFPVPVLALRTLKSDPIVGLPSGMDTQLDSVDPLWRVNGRRGVIQFRG